MDQNELDQNEDGSKWRWIKIEWDKMELYPNGIGEKWNWI